MAKKRSKAKKDIEEILLPEESQQETQKGLFSFLGKKERTEEIPVAAALDFGDKKRLKEIDYLLKQKAKELDEKEERLDEKEQILKEKTVLLDKKEEKLDIEEKELTQKEKDMMQNDKAARQNAQKVAMANSELQRLAQQKSNMQKEISMIRMDINSQKMLKEKIEKDSKRLHSGSKDLTMKEHKLGEKDERLRNMESEVSRKEKLVRQGFDLLKKEKEEWDQRKKRSMDSSLSLQTDIMARKKELAELERLVRESRVRKENTERRVQDLQATVQALEKKDQALKQQERDIAAKERELAQKDSRILIALKDKQTGLEKMQWEKRKLEEEISLLSKKKENLRQDMKGAALFKHREDRAKQIEDNMHNEIVALRMQNAQLKKQMDESIARISAQKNEGNAKQIADLRMQNAQLKKQADENLAKIDSHKKEIAAKDKNSSGNVASLSRENTLMKKLLFDKDQEIKKIKEKAKKAPVPLPLLAPMLGKNKDSNQGNKDSKQLEDKKKELAKAAERIEEMRKQNKSLEREIEMKDKAMHDLERKLKLGVKPHKDSDEPDAKRSLLPLPKAPGLGLFKASPEKNVEKAQREIEKAQKERDKVLADIRRLEEKRDEIKQSIDMSSQKRLLPALPMKPVKLGKDKDQPALIMPRDAKIMEEDRKAFEEMKNHRNEISKEIDHLEKEVKELQKKKDQAMKAQPKGILPLPELAPMKPVASKVTESRSNQTGQEIYKLVQMKKDLIKDIKDKQDQLASLDSYINKKEKEHAAERYKLDAEKEKLKVQAEVIKKREQEMKEKSSKIDKLDMDISAKEKDWGKKYQQIMDAKKELEEIRKEIKEDLPEEKNQIKILEDSWKERIEAMNIARGIMSAEKKEIKNKLDEMEDVAKRLAVMEKGIVAKVKKLDKERTMLGKKEKEVEEVIEGIEIMQKDVKDFEEELENREKELNEWEESLDTRERQIAKDEKWASDNLRKADELKAKIAIVKEVRMNINKMNQELLGVQKMIAKEKENLNNIINKGKSVQQQIDERQKSLEARERAFIDREKGLNEEREIFEEQSTKIMKEKEDLEDEEFKIFMEEELVHRDEEKLEHKKMFHRRDNKPQAKLGERPRTITLEQQIPKEIQAVKDMPRMNLTLADMEKLKSKIRALIRSKSFGEAENAIHQLEAAYPSIKNESEKTKMEYDVMELRTDLELAMLS